MRFCNKITGNFFPAGAYQRLGNDQFLGQSIICFFTQIRRLDAFVLQDPA